MFTPWQSVDVGTGAHQDPDQLDAHLAAASTVCVDLDLPRSSARLTLSDQPDGDDSATVRDIERLRLICSGVADMPPPTTVLGRTLAGLELRRRRAGGPLTIVVRTDRPHAGEHLHRGIVEAARRCSPYLQRWIVDNVDFRAEADHPATHLHP